MQAIDLKHIPLLTDNIPYENTFIRAEEIMQPHVVHLNSVTSVASLQLALKTGHTNFPIVNSSNNLIGIISSRFIKVLIVK
jgi:predicted transcriptional regulator